MTRNRDAMHTLGKPRKLTDQQVEAIRRLVAEIRKCPTVRQIAEHYHVSPSLVRAIACGRQYKQPSP